MELKQKITVEAIVKAPINIVWKLWTAPDDIVNWNNASDDWHTPRAENDLRIGGKFLYRMEAKDGSFGFDFNGVYDRVKNLECIAYTIVGGRKVEIHFTTAGAETKIVETFEAEDQHSIKQQHDGWQSILNNFKNYVETKS
jgi:uncharacterized protein YndB with AHSA1/START domain